MILLGTRSHILVHWYELPFMTAVTKCRNIWLEQIHFKDHYKFLYIFYSF